MNYQLRRKIVFQTPQTTESQIPTARSVTSPNQEAPRIVIKTDESEAIPQSDNRLKNWNDVFGDFLSEALLKRKETQLKRNTDTNIPRAYLHEVPFKINNVLIQSPSVRQNFAKFISGELSAEEFINKKNQAQKLDKLIPTTQKKQKRPKINVSYRRSAVTDDGNYELGFLKLLDEKNEEMVKKQQVRARFDIIKEVIENKVEAREKEDLVKRSREMKNVGLIKQMYDISDEYIQRLQKQIQEKDKPTHKRSLYRGGQISVISHQNPYQEVKSRNHENPSKVKYEAPQQKYIIRYLVDKKAKEYIEELQIKDFIENEKAKKKIFINYQFKKNMLQQGSRIATPKSFDDSQVIKQIYPFIQKGDQSKIVLKNQLINNDLELIKYITNYPKYDPFNDKEGQAQAQKELLLAGGLKESQRIFKKKQRFKKYKLILNKPHNMDDSRTDDESLNSMYEFNVDNLYQQSRQLQSKLLEKGYTDGFGKTIRAIQKNEQIKSDIIIKNIQKLEGLSPV